MYTYDFILSVLQIPLALRLLALLLRLEPQLLLFHPEFELALSLGQVLFPCFQIGQLFFGVGHWKK